MDTKTLLCSPPFNICFRAFPLPSGAPPRAPSHLFTPHMAHRRLGIVATEKDRMVRTWGVAFITS